MLLSSSFQNQDDGSWCLRVAADQNWDVFFTMRRPPKIELVSAINMSILSRIGEDERQQLV